MSSWAARDTEQGRLGTCESGQSHFNVAGYRDGRLPRPM